MPLILGAGTGGNRTIINLQWQGEEEDTMKIICSQLSVFVCVRSMANEAAPADFANISSGRN